MKLFRDMFAAVLIGIMGGFVFCVFSYYQSHKEGGVRQTANAVVNSFHQMTKSLGNEQENVLMDYVEDDILDERDFVAAFKEVEQADRLSDSYCGILRFHIRANSDTKEDQELKMAVKDDVICMLEPMLSQCENITQCKNKINENLQNIYTTARNTIMEQGYDYPVSVYMTKEQFPAKEYGDLTFPAGSYQALRIDIGSAKGKNWWCVMFPPLCFVDSSTAIVTKEGKESLKRAMTEEEFEALISGKLEDLNENKKIEIKGESWIYNWWKRK